jgi:glycosyltransferase involved in cell wall biosynthesis
MKKITAVLPTIGRMRYLDLAIESILNQDKSFDEIIIFDNSVEQNIEKLSKYNNYRELTFIKSGQHLNAIDSWNTAVSYATNEYVTIIGDDDILMSNYYENIQGVLVLSDVGILKAISIDENSEYAGELIYPDKTLLTYSEFRNDRFNGKISLFVPGIVFKKELFLKVGGFKNTYIDGLAYADELLLTELSFLSSTISVSKKVCWKYRIHSAQIAGVKDISTYVSRSEKYIKLYETSLISIGMKKEDIFLEFTKQDYIDKVSRYGLKLYGAYSGEHKSIFTYISNLINSFVFDNRISLKSRLKITLSSLRSFVGTCRIGKLIKGMKNRC